MPVEAEEGLGKETVYDGRLFSVVKERVRLPGGRESLREIVVHPGAVALVVVDGDGRLVLVRQYRRATGKTLLEVPAGTREPGESAEECARREVREETGYEARSVEHLGGFYSAPGFCTEYLECFLMTELAGGESAVEEDENIDVEHLTLEEALDAVRRGKICDAKTIAGIMLWLTLRPDFVQTIDDRR